MALSLPACSEEEGAALDGLRGRFEQPSPEARPLVWWHWMNGNITPEGLRKDIEWMDRSGIAGFHVFDAGLETPQIVGKRLDYMTAPWKKAFAGAVRLADSLGMEMTIASSPGWSSTGGPWVSVEDAMKKLVWRERTLRGGRHFHGPLPAPFGVCGYIQDIPLFGVNASHKDVAPVDSFYRDLFVVAERLPADTPDLTDAVVTSSMGPLDAARLMGDSWADLRPLTPDAAGKCWVEFSFPTPRRIMGITYYVGKEQRSRGHAKDPVCYDTLRVSDDGVSWRAVSPMPMHSSVAQTVSFAPVEGRYWRVDYRPQGRYRGAQPMLGLLRLHATPRVHHAEEKAGQAAAHDLALNPTPSALPAGCPVSEVVDLTDRCRDGVLDWDVPEGLWRVYRFGWSLTGKRNHPASPEATGLEVDKLDPAAWTRYFTHYLDMYKDASGGLMGSRGIRYVLTDSYEANSQTWTPALRDEFVRRRGYDPLPWFPVLAGSVIGTPAESDAFLWDWRRTIGELFAENYAVLTRLVREKYGMAGCYIESHENGRVFIADGMDIKKSAVFPMSAHWMQEGGPVQYARRMEEGEADIRESASVAHLYGQNRVAAESLTANGDSRRAYTFCPENLKPVADHMLACGLNRFVIHESAHQPDDVHVPGLTLGRYGQWFNRHETWAEEARSWTDYLARSCQMLMEGRFSADILLLYGEDSNVTGQYSSRFAPVPAGYAFDYLSPSALKECIYVRKGRYATPFGMSYRMLCLNENCRRMSVELLRRIRHFARKGAFICGVIPEGTTGLKEDRAEFDALVKDIWYSGRPHVYGGVPLAEALERAGIRPDVRPSDGAPMPFVHRILPYADIYWLSNPSDSARTLEVSLGTDGRIPALWHPEDASVEPLSWHREGGRTTVSLDLVAHDAVFVVFSGKAGAKTEGRAPVWQAVERQVLDGNWRLTFQAGRGADGKVLEVPVGSLTEQTDPAVRHFSGTMTYSRTFDAVAPAPGERVCLDLGAVANLARVTLNGRDLGLRWHAPFRFDVGDALCDGTNELTVAVTNLWPNRLIGDCREDAVPLTYTGYKYYKADDPLLPSGLLGPVRLLSVRETE